MNFTKTTTNNEIATIKYVETDSNIKLFIDNDNEHEMYVEYNFEIFDNYENENKTIKEINVSNEKYFKNQIEQLNQILQYLFQYINCVKKEYGENIELNKLVNLFTNTYENTFNFVNNNTCVYDDNLINFNLKINKLFTIKYLFGISNEDSKFDEIKLFNEELKSQSFTINYEKNLVVKNNILNIIKFYSNYVEKLIINKINNFIIYVVNDIFINKIFDNAKTCQTNFKMYNIKQCLQDFLNIEIANDHYENKKLIKNLVEKYDDLNKYFTNINDLSYLILNMNSVRQMLNIENLSTTNDIINKLKYKKHIYNMQINKHYQHYYCYVVLIYAFMQTYKKIKINTNNVAKSNLVNELNSTDLYLIQMKDVMNRFEIEFDKII